MAGDRRATAGSSIAHRAMDKVHPADRHSGVAIAGAAGPAMEMVRLFQLQLEHYEKVEGPALSLEGKANQLSQMVRSNLAMAMQGFVVVPLFAGYDLRRGVGRIYTYDPTGGRYEETDFHADGSGGRDARTTIKLGWHAVTWTAPAPSSWPCGPCTRRPTRTRPPAAPTRPRHLPDGGHHHRRRLRAGARGRGGRALRRRGRRPRSERPTARRRGQRAMSMPFYVAPEQFMKDKADFARKNIARGRPLVATVYADGILICAENPSQTLHKVSEIYDRIAFAGVGRYNEFDQLRRSGVQHADVKGYQFSREDVDARSLANLYAQYIGNVFTHEMKPLEVEILVAEVGADPGGDQLFHILYDGTVVDEDRFTVLGGEAEAITARLEGRLHPGPGLGGCPPAGRPGPGRARAVPGRGRARGGGADPCRRAPGLPPGDRCRR